MWLHSQRQRRGITIRRCTPSIVVAAFVFKTAADITLALAFSGAVSFFWPAGLGSALFACLALLLGLEIRKSIRQSRNGMEY